MLSHRATSCRPRLLLPLGSRLHVRYISAVSTINYQTLFRKLKLDYYNSGVYYGVWKSINDIDTFVHHNNIQVNPSTDDVLGEVYFGGIHDYNTAIQAMDIGML